MAIKHVVTMGFGSFGDVNYIPTIGYGNFEVVIGPYSIAAQSAFIPGSVRASVFRPGDVACDVFKPGVSRKEVIE
jgi:hypothetical protein